jgi:hypothetical protein
MGIADYFKRGEWNFHCDLCGRKRKSGDGVKTWNGLWACREHKEQRNPQDFVRGVKDDQSVPWSRPEAADQFVPLGWTRQLDDTLYLSETVSSQQSLVVPRNAVPEPFAPINSFVLGGSPSTLGWSTPSNSETLAVSEVVNGQGQLSPADAAALAEVVAFQILNSTQLNGRALNGAVLNG